MGISKFVDGKTKNKKSLAEPCHKNSIDCMFLDQDSGTCRAEWCIFEELPEMVNIPVHITCSICRSNSKTVSAYSSERSYICDSCASKIRALFTHSH